MDDHQLLREYRQNRSQEAFRELVDRHLPMVYSVARRLVRDDQLAEEVAQGVFTTLAQKAGSIAPPQIVAGWLYNTARHLSMHAVRGEQRRREREQTAAAMHSLHFSPDADRIADQLEPAMSELEPAERDVLTLRFLENRSLRDVGLEIGVNEDAARMRVNRALEEMRRVLDRRGVGLTPTLLASALVASTVSAAPAGLTAVIMTTAFAGTIATVTTAPAIIATMNWINTKTIAAVLSAALVAGTSSYLVQQRAVDRALSDSQNLIAEQQQLKADRDAALSAAGANRAEMDRLRAEAADVVRLRGQINQLRQGQVRAAAAAKPAQPEPAAARPAATAAPYIGREQLAHVGYATPEAALQTIGWASVTGTPEQAKEGLAEGIAGNVKAYAAFENSRKSMAEVFTGMEIQAKKVISPTEVELKVRTDMAPSANGSTPMPPHVIVSLVKNGDEWKMASSRIYRDTWEQTGQIESPTLVGR